MIAIKFRKLLCLIVLPIVGCATGAPYKQISMDSMSMSRGLGYEDMKIREGVYRVRFQGNGNDTPGVVYKAFLRRASEITLENGFEKFTVVDGKSNNAVAGAMGVVVSAPSFEGEVHIFKARAPAEALDAKETIKEFQKKK